MARLVPSVNHSDRLQTAVHFTGGLVLSINYSGGLWQSCTRPVLY